MISKIDWDKSEEEHDEYLQEVTGYPLSGGNQKIMLRIRKKMGE